MAELKYWLWLAGRKGLGAGKAGILLRYFGSPEEVYFARGDDYAAVLGVDIPSLRDKNMDEAKKVLWDCDECEASILTLGDAQYPARLKNIYDAPLVLYTKGHPPRFDEEPAVAIVGTRRASNYGLTVAEKLANEYASAGGTVITGLAHGIDTAAARGALMGGGRPVGVLGCGIDVVYPLSNAELFEDMLFYGSLVSEYPPGTEPHGRNFPARNRVMSGLSVGVVVVEAPERSGALITASHALEQGRDVFAVPGAVDSRNSVGTNALLREGATPITCGDDLIDEYRDRFPDKLTGKPGKEPTIQVLQTDPLAAQMAAALEKAKKERKQSKAPKKPLDNGAEVDYIELTPEPSDLSEEERAVLRVITEPGMHVDKIIVASELTPSEVLSALTMLELDGAVTQEPGKRFTARVKLQESAE
ncbi:MAG: DNA-processing protein DprA [bacterium]